MPDITDRKKEKIRIIAKTYCSILSKIPFEEGVSLYSKTYQALSMSSARWRLCLMCGEIDYSETFSKSTHKCASLLSYSFPIIVKTSWIKLEEFFLNENHLDYLKDQKGAFGI